VLIIDKVCIKTCSIEVFRWVMESDDGVCNGAIDTAE
jgi:hypothetical protein